MAHRLMDCERCTGLGVRYSWDMTVLEDPCSRCGGAGHVNECEFCEDGNLASQGWHTLPEEGSGRYRVACLRTNGEGR